MCKAEKDAWHKLDQLEDECETMYKQVETKTEVLVSYEFNTQTHGYTQTSTHKFLLMLFLVTTLCCLRACLILQINS